LKKLHHIRSSGAPISKELKAEHKHGRRIESTNCALPGTESVVRTTILDDTTTAKNATQHWAQEKEADFEAEVWMNWTDGSR
jgi:hypothetical protein